MCGVSMATEKRNEFGFVGTSATMQILYDKIGRVAKSDAPVFVEGETGTGKELCALAVHQQSARADGSFIAVNCGAIPHELMESEMFGHLKGAFTGAISDHDGAAKQADGGTLFLDEICELPLALQTKLLRFLQTGVIQRVGAKTSEKVDVRIVCATNKDPRAEMAEGRLREDLFFRLFVLPVKIPPLRLRGCDISLVANYFLKEFSAEEKKSFAGFNEEALQMMEDYDWPGNVRELQNVVRQAVVMNDGREVTAAMLADFIHVTTSRFDLDFSGLVEEQTVTARLGHFKSRQLWQIERDAIEAAIVASNGSIPLAAKELGVSPSTIYRKRESWKVERRA